MGAGDGGVGGQAGFPLEQWFWEMPLCTRWWTTATVLTSALVQCQIVTPFQLFYSFRAVFVKSQVRPTIRLTLHVGQL
jgi:Derlin-2/3